MNSENGSCNRQLAVGDSQFGVWRTPIGIRGMPNRVNGRNN